MVVLEPRVNEEKLGELLAFGTESPELDFKEMYDLSETRDRVELARHVGAMQVDGGYLVIGADSHGVPQSKLTRGHAELFDEARLSQILAKWIPAPFDLLVARHEANGDNLVLIYVAPSSRGLCIFKTDGQYQDANGKTVTVFRQGDVYVRDGTQSRRWQQPDIDRIIDRIREVERERWRAELVDDFRDILERGGTTQTLARGPARALTWQLDEGSFDAVVIEQLRQDDTIPLKLLLDQIPSDFSQPVAEERANDALTLLDRLTCLLALLIRVERIDLLDRTIDTLRIVYQGTFDTYGLDRQLGPPLTTDAIRLAIIQRVMAVGAFAVRRRDWRTVRKLVLQRPGGRDFEQGLYTNWIRHAQTMAARAELFSQRDERGRKTEVGLLSFVLATASRLPCLHPDISSAGVAEDDRLIDSVISFDVLAMMAVLGRAPGDRYYSYYPSFAGFYWRRFEPVLVELRNDEAMRKEIYPHDDAALRKDISQMLAWAKREGVRFGGGGPLTNAQLLEFLGAVDQGD